MRRSALVAALATLSGCPLFSMEAQIPEMCVTFNDRAILGVPDGEDYRESLIADPLTSFGAFFELSGEVRSATARIKARSGASDLMFLETVRVSMRGIEPGAEMPPAALVNCDGFTCASPSDVAELTTRVPGDVMEYVRRGRVQIDVTLSGPLPKSAWNADIEVCLSGEASLELSL